MKDFTLHTEALELKQLGFDEPCLFYYYGSNDLQSLIQIDMPRLVNHNESILGTCYSAPSYSQAFRWFREKHKIISVIDFTCDGDNWEDVEYNVKISEFAHFKTHDTFVEYGYKTYEEAELACLREMIKIVKNNYGKQ